MNTLGNTKAEMVGGNLCILAHLIGSKNAIDTNGKILFLEDVGSIIIILIGYSYSVKMQDCLII